LIFRDPFGVCENQLNSNNMAKKVFGDLESHVKKTEI
jgi:hypothetical protein